MGGGGKGKGGGGDVDVDVDSDSFSTSSMTLDLIGLDDINVGMGGTDKPLSTVMQVGGTDKPMHTITEMRLPQPLQTEMSTSLAITEPIRTEMTTDARIDVEPVVVDLCLTVGVRDLPRQVIRRPYHRQIGLRLLGVELLGLEWSGESSTIIDDLPSRPHVEGGGGAASGARGRPHEARETVRVTPPGAPGGLRIVLGE